MPLERTIDNNNEDANAIIGEHDNAAINRRHELFSSDETDSPASPPIHASCSNHTQLRFPRKSRQRNIIFQAVPKHSPVSLDTLGLRRHPRISTLKRKQLEPTLNQAIFPHETHTSEEDNDPLKDHCTSKEANKSQFRENVVSAMVKEIDNHTNKKHWKCYRKSDTPASLIM